MGMAVGMPEVKGLPAAVDLAKNPLAETHEFKQACSLCYVKTGKEICFCVVSFQQREVVFDLIFIYFFFFLNFISTGPGVLDYTLHTEEHKCKKDALLGRIKHSPDKTWKLIRPRPTKTQYVGPYYICKGNL